MIGAGENARSLTEFTLRSFAKARMTTEGFEMSRGYRMKKRLGVISSGARNLFPCSMEFGTDAVQNNTEARRLHGGKI